MLASQIGSLAEIQLRRSFGTFNISIVQILQSVGWTRSSGIVKYLCASLFVQIYIHVKIQKCVILKRFSHSMSLLLLKKIK